MTSPWVALLAATACDGNGGGGNDTKDDTGSTCTVEFEESYPEDGAVDVYYRTRLSCELTDPDPFGANLEIDGVTGDVSAEGDTLWFDPHAPLDPNTTYTATCSWCGGSKTITFSTSDLGTPLADPDALAGRVFSIPFGECRIAEPSELASQLYDYLTQVDLLQVDAVGDGTIEMTNALASGTSTTQDHCIPTTAFDGADFSESPYFEASADCMIIVLQGEVVRLQEVQFHGTFTADGLGLGGGEVSYVMDTRPFDQFVGGEEGDLCAAARNLGAECFACPDGAGDFCLSFLLDECAGEVVDGGSVVEVDGVDCVDCDLGPPAEDAVCDTGTSCAE
ncbi:MAG: Ig-like domain-containing protein [Myxococcota bacterium]